MATAISEVKPESWCISFGYLEMNEGVKRLGKGDRERRKSLQVTVPGHQPNPWQSGQWEELKPDLGKTTAQKGIMNIDTKWRQARQSWGCPLK